jgi:hypothetical protein
MNFDRSASMGEIDGRSLISIDFCVPVLTPRLHGSEAALQLFQNLTFFVVCCKHTRIISKEV